MGTAVANHPKRLSDLVRGCHPSSDPFPVVSHASEGRQHAGKKRVCGALPPQGHVPQSLGQRRTDGWVSMLHGRTPQRSPPSAAADRPRRVDRRHGDALARGHGLGERQRELRQTSPLSSTCSPSQRHGARYSHGPALGRNAKGVRLPVAPTTPGEPPCTDNDDQHHDHETHSISFPVSSLGNPPLCAACRRE